MTTLAVGARVGPYCIVGELGAGGMGVVYRAVHTLLGRPAAIKVLRPELAGCPVSVEWFLAEACAAAVIRHPGVVEIYDYGFTERGQAFLAMELLEGETLSARLARCGRLPGVDAMVLARRIALALAAAHRRGVVHRDLKPDNVFLVRDHDGGGLERLKLFDFGVASFAGARTAALPLGTIVGTPAYMSPEQCRGATRCDHRTDLYALGCILFEALSGLPPFGRGPVADELIAAHLRRPLPGLGADVPRDVAALVRRLLAKRADDRPQDALEVVAEIDRWLVGDRAAPRRLATRVASGIAASLADLGARAQAWCAAVAPGRTRLERGAVTRAAALAGDGAMVTSAPTQPMTGAATVSGSRTAGRGSSAVCPPGRAAPLALDAPVDN